MGALRESEVRLRKVEMLVEWLNDILIRDWFEGCEPIKHVKWPPCQATDAEYKELEDLFKEAGWDLSVTVNSDGWTVTVRSSRG